MSIQYLSFEFLHPMNPYCCLQTICSNHFGCTPWRCTIGIGDVPMKSYENLDSVTGDFC